MLRKESGFLRKWFLPILLLWVVLFIGMSSPTAQAG